jgi:hypothetical protein
MTLPDWFNGTFILSLITLVGGGATACLRYFLKSRCTSIKCCCIECNRDVLPADSLNEVSLSGTPRIPTV